MMTMLDNRYEPNLLVYHENSIDTVKVKEDRENDNKERFECDSCFLNFFDRHLIIENNQFMIVPNGGSGDCLFKAIAQAMSEEDDEANHLVIRCQVVDFVLKNSWGKLKDSIEIQHISGNAELSECWANDPMRCYKKYMTQAGTLGSFIELTAAAELLQFHFTSIQEYSKDIKTYRVENFGSSVTNNNDKPIYHFLFTGDYESGHWEHLVPVSANPGKYLNDGTYHGTLFIVIDGVQTSLDEWLTDLEEKNKQPIPVNNNHDSGSEKSEPHDGGSIREDEQESAFKSVQDDNDKYDDTTTDGEVQTQPFKFTKEKKHSHSHLPSVDVDNVDGDYIGTTTEAESTMSEEYDTTNGSDNSMWEEFIPKKPNHLFQVKGESETSLLTSRESERKQLGKNFSRRSESSTFGCEAIDKKKGCFKTFVSYFSNILH